MLTFYEVLACCFVVSGAIPSNRSPEAVKSYCCQFCIYDAKTLLCKKIIHTDLHPECLHKHRHKSNCLCNCKTNDRVVVSTRFECFLAIDDKRWWADFVTRAYFWGFIWIINVTPQIFHCMFSLQYASDFVLCDMGLIKVAHSGCYPKSQEGHVISASVTAA